MNEYRNTFPFMKEERVEGVKDAQTWIRPYCYSEVAGPLSLSPLGHVDCGGIQ